jgi:hypothetical protein
MAVLLGGALDDWWGVPPESSRREGPGWDWDRLGRDTCLLCWRVDRPHRRVRCERDAEMEKYCEGDFPGGRKVVERGASITHPSQNRKGWGTRLAWLKRMGKGYQAGSGKGG